MVFRSKPIKLYRCTNAAHIALTYQDMNRGTLRCAVVPGTGTQAADPVGLVFRVLLHPTNAQLGWNLRSLEARSMLCGRDI